MSWFNNLKLKVKMMVSFGIVITMVIVLSVLAAINLKNVDDAYTTVLETSVIATGNIMDFSIQVNDLRRLVAGFVAFANDTEHDMYERHEQGANKAYALGLEALEMYDSLVYANPNLDQAARQVRLSQSDELRQAFNQYWNEAVLPIKALAYEFKQNEAVDALLASSGLTADLTEKANAMIDQVSGSRDRQKDDATAKAAQTLVLLIVVSVVIVVVSIILAFFVAAIISKPLMILSAFMKKAGTTGDVRLQPEEVASIGKISKMKDEIGETVGNAALFVQHVTHVSEELESIAQGDLTRQLEVLSEIDVMGQALKQTVTSLHTMFTDINSASVQVAGKADLVEEGAKQIASTTTNIAEGAQTLAKGSTDQAASVQELSGSIAVIEEKTGANAEIADQASRLADTVIGNAEKGSRQMEDMIEAVREIAEANQSIQSIMNTIDSIASQTNLLSLNAAIEAARAGEHGRGFAVVADEVRILAAQSAEAAQKTSAIIKTSIEKSQLGTQIVDATAESFKEIVAGLNESSRLIKNIATASEEQAVNIKQIKSGIDLVSDIVEQNSATAEESAAASQESAAAATDSITAAEELKVQADILKKLVLKFKLNE